MLPGMYSKTILPTRDTLFHLLESQWQGSRNGGGGGARVNSGGGGLAPKAKRTSRLIPSCIVDFVQE